MKNLLAIFGLACLVAFVSCSKITPEAPAAQPGKIRTAVTLSKLGATGTENFDNGTKTAYAAADVTLASGTWNLNDALLGNSTSDRKNGTQSVRLRNSGKLTMKFDNAQGAATVSVSHARYGTDGNSTWQLWYSTNAGASYTQTGSTITTSSTTLAVASFTLNLSGNIRFEIRKTDGSANRLNIDDFTVVDYGTGGGGGGGGTAKKFLFDASQGETAGNADWVIDQDNSTPQRIPTPLQSTITSSTGETYWTGGISAWGIALAKQGHTVETLPSTGSITYGSTTNAQDLSRYDVFVVDEPNIRFTTAEKTAILNFVNNGGGLVMIGNHSGSDRNSDGWDAPAIWNDLMSNNSVKANPFGMSFDLVNIVQLTSNVSSTSHPVLNGSQGTVSQLEYNNGSTLTLNTTANSTVSGLIWRSGVSQTNTNVMCAVASYGTGRVFALCDSSPTDDGTGAPNNTLYNGWGVYSHQPLLMNASHWAAKLQ